MDDEMGKLLFGDPNANAKYKLVRESDGLTKHGQTAGWIEWKKKDDEWKEWGVDYLRKNLKLNKVLAEKEMQWVNLQWGLKYSDWK